MEAAALVAEKITADKHDNPNSYHIGCMKQPGCYSKKSHNFLQNDKEITRQSKTTNRKCRTCSSKQCPGHKSCPAYHECFDCHKKGHCCGAIVCTYSKKANSKADSADTSDRESDSSDESTDIESALIQNDTTLRQKVKLSKYVTKIRRVRQKEVRKFPNSQDI